MDNSQKSSKAGKYLTFDFLWIIFVLVLYVLAKGGSAWVKSLFSAGYLQ